MKDRGHRRWLSGSLVAGLVLAAAVSGPGDQTEYSAFPVRKSDFHLTEYVAEGVEAFRRTVGQEDAIQAFIGNDMMTEAAVVGASGQETASGDTADAKSHVVTAGSSGTITAGGSETVTAGGGQGPSIYGSIVTEGEKAQMGQQIPQEQILGGASLTLLNSQSSSQMLSAILQALKEAAQNDK